MVCVFHLIAVASNFNDSILDDHAFRQSQTAISVYWLSQDGLSIDYPMPVFGRPWSTPIEFPLYQWICACTSRLGMLSMVQWCRVWTLIFLYIALVGLWVLSRELELNLCIRIWMAIAFLINPTALFWGRAVLMESTALAASV